MASCDSHAMSRVLVRTAVENDLDIVGRISVEAYRAAGQLDNESEDGYALVLSNARARYSEALLLVAIHEDVVVGTVTICPIGSRFHEIGEVGEVEFRFLAVAPFAWGGGVGTALIDACHHHARDVGATRLVICVRDTNAGAISMYVRYGFTRMPERDWEPVPGVRLLGFMSHA